MNTTYKSAPALDLNAVWKNHRRPMLWTFGSIAALTLLYTIFGPRTYTSEAKLFVRLGRESVSMDPTATTMTDQVVMVHESREYEINSVFELLKSREVLSNVVSSVGPQVVLERGPRDDSTQVAGMFGMLQSLNVLGPDNLDDVALKHLAKRLNFMAIKKSNVINISYEAKTPELARDVVARVIEQARDTHIRVHRTEGSQDFFGTQADQLRRELTALELELRDIKNQAGIASLPDQRTLKLEQISELQTSLLKARASLSAALAETRTHEASLDEVPETIMLQTTVGMPDSSISTMREQLFTAQIVERELLSRCTPEHPRAKAASQHVAALQAILDEEPVTPQHAQGPNSTHQELRVAHMKGNAAVASLEAQVATLNAQLAPVMQDLVAINNTETEITRLEREIELKTASYKRYSSSYEQARIDHELVMNNISNLSVMQPPSYSLTPTKPRRLLNLAAGLIMALSASAGVGLVLEQRRSGWLTQFWSNRSSGGSASATPVTTRDPLHAAPSEGIASTSAHSAGDPAEGTFG